MNGLHPHLHNTTLLSSVVVTSPYLESRLTTSTTSLPHFDASSRPASVHIDLFRRFLHLC